MLLMRGRISRPNLALPMTPQSASALARRYGFPVVSSSMRRVAVLEFGGGYDPADIAAYAAANQCKVPNIVNVSVDGANNAFSGDPNSADGEVALDMQLIVGATGGEVGITMYWCPNSDAGFADGFARVAQDATCDAVSLSWGLSEAGWSSQARQAVDSGMAACNALGIPTFAASGDDGSRDQGRGNNVDFPASSPECIGVGGTSVAAGGEVAWSFGGGGVSAVYRKPSWQALAPGGMRCIPDVAADADPQSGYPVIVAGRGLVLGGTSGAAPMLAAYKTLIDTVRGERTKKFVELMYANLALFHDITGGSNGAFRASPGYDSCTGCGTPSPALTAALVKGAPPPVLPPVPVGTLTFTVDPVNRRITLPPGWSVG